MRFGGAGEGRRLETKTGENIRKMNDKVSITQFRCNQYPNFKEIHLQS